MLAEGMRGVDQRQNHIFSYLSPEERVRKDHPLRVIRAMVDEVLKQRSPSPSASSFPAPSAASAAATSSSGQRRSLGLRISLRQNRLMSYVVPHREEEQELCR
jgi:hypothetical protein